MGNASAAASATASCSRSQESKAMFCDHCGTKFALFSRKKVCSQCKNSFCSSCVNRDAIPGLVRSPGCIGDRTCRRCKALLRKPPVRADLMELRVKDLQRYLGGKHVNTSACVEKKDLVELVIRQNGGIPAAAGAGASAAAAAAANGPSSQQSRLRRDPVERSKNFPKSYTESTHRHDWLAKLEEDNDGNADARHRGGGGGGEEEENIVEDFVMVPTPTEEEEEEETGGRSRVPASEVTPVEAFVNQASEEDEEEEGAAGGSEGADDKDQESDDKDQDCDDDSAVVQDIPHLLTPPSPTEDTRQETGVTQGGGEGAKQQDEAAATTTTTATTARTAPLPASRLTDSLNTASSSLSASPSSPRRFANQGLVYLSELKSLDDLHELSVKQMKDILAMSRVHYKGVVEKEELLKMVQRLWNQEQKMQKVKDDLEDDELCKICMDRQVDCVMLECGHMCTCTDCGKQMAECPICRQYVVRVVRTFRA